MGRRVTLPVLTMVVVLVINLPGLARAQTSVDWTQFRFNQRHTGVQPFETDITVANAKFLWPAFQDQLGALVDGSSPAVVGGVAYIGSDDGTLWAYPADGCGQGLCTTPLWRSTNLAQIIDAPAVANGVVFVGSQTSVTSAAGKLNAFAAAGCGHALCPPLWQGDAGAQSILESSPTVARGVVYVAAYDGKLYAFDAGGCGHALCQPLWTGATGGHVESSPTVVNGVAYVGSDDGNLYAFAAAGCGSAACAPLWSGSIGAPAFSSSPAVSGGRVPGRRLRRRDLQAAVAGDLSELVPRRVAGRVPGPRLHRDRIDGRRVRGGWVWAARVPAAVARLRERSTGLRPVLADHRGRGPVRRPEHRAGAGVEGGPLRPVGVR